jgi:putative endonuclease
VTHTRRQGSHWEQVAETFLRQRGLRTLEKNFQARFGEIDLIMQQGNTLVFTEVRYRRSDRHGSGAETVNPRKQQRIVKAARLYLHRHARFRDRPCRFDVVSIGQREGSVLIDWVRNAFEAGGP